MQIVNSFDDFNDILMICLFVNLIISNNLNLMYFFEAFHFVKKKRPRKQ